MAEINTGGLAAEMVSEDHWQKYLEPLLVETHEQAVSMAMAAASAGDTLATAKAGAIAIAIEEIVGRVYMDAHGKVDREIAVKSEVRRVSSPVMNGSAKPKLWRPDQI